MFLYTEARFKYIHVCVMCIYYISIYDMTIDEGLCEVRKGSKGTMREKIIVKKK